MNTQLRFQRRELKYYLPEQLCPEVIRLIRPYMTLDEHLKGNEAKSYLVRSLYLDTDDLKFYHEKLAGSHTRRKFRIRGYNDNRSEVFLEIKRKYNDIIVKERALIHHEEIAKILSRYGGYHPNGNRSEPEMKVIIVFICVVVLGTPPSLVSHSLVFTSQKESSTVPLVFSPMRPPLYSKPVTEPVE